jgi:DNA-binding HxlR family transcriptional regulator
MTYESVRTLLAPKRTVEVLALLGENEILNYSDIESQIESSSDVISDRLAHLNEAGLVERTEYSKRDVRYTITENGRGFLVKLNELEDLLDQE